MVVTKRGVVLCVRQDIKGCHLKTSLIESMHAGVEILRMHGRE